MLDRISVDALFMKLTNINVLISTFRQNHHLLPRGSVAELAARHAVIFYDDLSKQVKPAEISQTCARFASSSSFSYKF